MKALRYRNSESVIFKAIQVKWVRICVILAISLSFIVTLVYSFLPVYRWVVNLFWLTILSNTLIPLAPHEPVILLYGGLHPPWLVAIFAGIAISVIEFMNYQVLLPIVNLEKSKTLREKRLYKRAEHYFSKFPFSSLIFACFTPVPFIPFRFLAVTTGYSIRKFILSVFLGRVPRFYLIALIGKALNLPLWVYVITLAAACGIALTKKLARRKKGVVAAKLLTCDLAQRKE